MKYNLFIKWLDGSEKLEATFSSESEAKATGKFMLSHLRQVRSYRVEPE